MKDLLILFAFLLAIALITGKLFEREKTLPQLFTILLLSNFAFYHIISYLLYCPLPFEIPRMNEWAYFLEAMGFVLFLFKGPTHYGYALSVVTSGKSFPKRYLLHFLPGIIFAAIYLPVAGMKISAAGASGGASIFFPGHHTIMLISVFLCVIIYDAYLIMCIILLYPMLRKYPKRNMIFKVILASYVAGICTTSFWPVDIMMRVEFTDDVRVGSLFYLIIIYLISCRYPERMVQLDIESKRTNYLKTQLQGVDTESIVARLEDLVHVEKVYKSQISLADLAGQLNIRQHQLSEILNSYMKTTFANYFNDQRVEEAKHLLESRPDLQIIEISLEIGFNTLSVFYREFKKRVGSSPAEYRRRFIS